MKSKPQNFRDLNWYFLSTGRPSYRIVSHEVVMDVDDADVGDILSKDVIVDCAEDHVTVVEDNTVLVEKKDEDDFVTTSKRKLIDRFDDFDEFVDSEWYEKVSEDFNEDYDRDSSWMDFFYAESDDYTVNVEFNYVERTKTGLSPDVRGVAMSIDKIGGGVQISIESNTYETSIDDVIDALEMVKCMKRFGLEFNREERRISVKLNERK